ncbi:hydantoinase/oxoprolinase family protein [Mycobacterium sp. SMC-4]|uniref:hydantoinase/oxoprolinase family protein n=1 Tax=Mycobacterium sp. SMC-4 TaxID=2857059 RepID=UPI0021B44B8C|nr:hydantoinase/oxoprolinase family protein [Mycobacterium sp. SMC-4]UXA16557.1 hydantoinase/oxoprolinase family protein [Mycobacterium sp. SMC-4]
MTVTTISIDTGGTFTDGFVIHDGQVHTVKTLTTPHDLLVCFRAILQAAADAVGVSTEELLRTTEVVRYATTVGTNQVIERTGPRLGLLSAQAAGSASGVGVFVDPDMVAELDLPPGARAADTAATVLGPIRDLLHRGARGLVVAAGDTGTEDHSADRIAEVFLENYPRHCLDAVPLLAAGAVAPDSDGHRRIATALFNAYVHPSAADFLYRAEDHLRSLGYRRPLLIVHNDGGAARVARTIAAKTYNSGPMAGLLGAREIAGSYGVKILVTLDMGGTSLDVGVVADGAVRMLDHGVVAGVEVSLPLPQLEPFGAGGGSIAWMDAGDLRVGPRSAGAYPGPACFGLGGTEPTVTDADTVLGILRPEAFMGGSMPLDVAAARRAYEHLAASMGLDVVQTAARVRATLHRETGRQLAEQLQAWGIDPTEVTVLAFGGNGPTHCAAIAQAAGIRDVLVMPYAPVFSAYGASTVDIVHRREAPMAEPGEPDPRPVLREAVLRDMRGEGYSAESVQVRTSLTTRDGRCYVAVEGRYQLPRATPAGMTGRNPAAAPESTEVFWENYGLLPTPIIEQRHAPTGFKQVGPALVDGGASTCVVPPGWSLTIDERGASRLRREGSGKDGL